MNPCSRRFQFLMTMILHNPLSELSFSSDFIFFQQADPLFSVPDAFGDLLFV